MRYKSIAVVNLTLSSLLEFNDIIFIQGSPAARHATKLRSRRLEHYVSTIGFFLVSRDTADVNHTKGQVEGKSLIGKIYLKL